MFCQLEESPHCLSGTTLKRAGRLQEPPVLSVSRPNLFCFIVNSQVRGTPLQIQVDIKQAVAVQQLDSPEVSCSWNTFAFRLVTFVKKCQGVEDGSPTLMRPSMPSATSLVESLLVPFPLFTFLYSTSKKCYTIFSVSLSTKNNTGWEDKTALTNLCFLLNCTPFFKTRKKSQLSAYIGPEKGRKYTKRECEKKKKDK